MSKILIIDDDTFICDILVKVLKDAGYQADTAFTGSTAMAKLKKNKFDLVICDYRLPDSDGVKMLPKIKSLNPEAEIIIITAYGDVRLAVKLMKMGATDYITKPIQQEELLDVINKIMERKHGKSSHEHFPAESFISGNSKTIKSVLKLSETVAPTDLSVVIEGETGSGKEYIARFIHSKSNRKNKPFVALDCGAIPRDLANSELFGHIKGSFTGAIKDRTGVFQEANGGTLFLDEVGNLTYDIQVRLLRAIQEKKVTKIGDTKSVSVDVRIISATNEDLLQEVNNNNFREDLYHRLNEFQISIPPLRERTEDIMNFANFFLEQANQRMMKNVRGFEPPVIRALEKYHWHGNIRELRNVINRAVLLSQEGLVSMECLPRDITEYKSIPGMSSNTAAPENEPDANNRLKDASHEFEKQLIMNTLEDVNFNKSKAARVLKIDRKTLYNKIKQYNIEL